MKKTITVVALLCLLSGFSSSSFAADPCEVVLCMYGKATGNSGGSECSSAEKAFFKINSFKKHHRFNPAKTADMRKNFLGQCASADPAHMSKILSKYGKKRG
ncbi:conjugal transfer protein [Salmonella enterica]|nr:conjugal transfer protein [Salmonella enterica]EKI5063001.1 conjugal transfer protein [Salmonella enterica]HCJ1012953.1 conjugal transfer protein [Salmonella enterica]